MKLFLSLLFSFVFILNASDISPELQKQLKANGKWKSFAESMQAAAAKGVNEPNKRAVNFDKILNSRNKTTYLNGLVILVDFDDKIADTTAHDTTAFQQLLFSEAIHPTGSMNDFYLENSYGQVGAKGKITDWLRMPQGYSYYVSGQAGFGNYPNNAQKLTEDAIEAADPYVDFSQFDNDNDGWVDALFIVHAGVGRESSGSSNDIHSHAWSITPQYRDGVIVSSYSMEPELHNTAGDMVHMGVFGHEFGHVLGLPDLYDTDYSSRGLGRWSMMAGGSWNNSGNTPAHFDVWSKYQLGWVNPVVLTADSSVNIPAIADSAAAYILWTEGQVGSEYFILENRQAQGFDSYIPGSGLLIYHIDETASGNSNDWHPLVMLEQADGAFQLQNDLNSGDNADPFPGSTSNTLFDWSTTPGGLSYGGENTFVSVSNISLNNGYVSADLSISVPFPVLSLTSTALTELGGDGQGDADPGETLKLSLVLQNIGTGADSIVVTINSDNPHITWTDSVEVLHNVGGDLEIQLTESFEFSISDSISDPSVVIFDILAFYPSGQFEDYFTILVGDNPGYSSNMEGDPRTWKHYPVSTGFSDEWHHEDYRNYTVSGQYSFKLGGAGSAPYSDKVHAALESPDIELGNQNDAMLSFYQVMIAEDDNNNTAWDGGLVEISENGGQTWQIIYPMGGYPYTIIDNPDSPFPAGTPVYSGVNTGWEQQQFDLSAYSGTVRIRFRFGSDGYVTEEGWYIDDVEVTATTTTGLPDLEQDINVQDFRLSQNYPNPFNPRTKFLLTVPHTSEVSLEIFDINGKKITSLHQGRLETGEYEFSWDGTNFHGAQVASGVYFIKLLSENFTQSHKMLLMR